MKTKLVIISLLLLSSLGSYAGNSATFGGAAIGAAAGAGIGSAFSGSRGALIGAVIGGLSGAAIASDNSGRSCNTYTRTERVYDCRPQYRNGWYTEEVEVCRPVVERRVYTRPVRERRVVTYNTCRPQRYTEVYYGCPAPVREYTECRTIHY